jgi:hypothetical protein
LLASDEYRAVQENRTTSLTGCHSKDETEMPLGQICIAMFDNVTIKEAMSNRHKIALSQKAYQTHDLCSCHRPVLRQFDAQQITF